MRQADPLKTRHLGFAEQKFGFICKAKDFPFYFRTLNGVMSVGWVSLANRSSAYIFEDAKSPEVREKWARIIKDVSGLDVEWEVSERYDD